MNKGGCIVRIAYITKYRIPNQSAHSVAILEMCKAFAKNGHETLFYSCTGNKPIANFHDKFLTIHQPCNVLPKKIQQYVNIFRVKRLKDKPDIIYSRNADILAKLASTRISLIYEAHDKPNKSQIEIQKVLFQQPNFVRLVVISNSLRNIYIETFPSLNVSKIIVAPSGANILNDSQQKLKNWIGRKGYLQAGYIGHLYPGKGIEDIVLLANQMADIDFHVVGGTSEDLKKWREKNLSSNLYLHGHVAHDEIEKYLNHFDITLAPFRRVITLKGGKGNVADVTSPLKIFEYMGAGKAIIASRLSVIEEVLRDGENALLAEPENIDQWMEKIRLLQDNPKLRQQIAAIARNEAINKYSWTVRAERVIKGIQSL